MPPEPPFTLTVHGERAILQLQQALGSTTRDDLIRLFRMIDAQEDLVGLHQVLPRLACVAPWLDLLWKGPAERYAGLAERAAALCRPEVAARWRGAVPEHRSSRGNVANSLTGQLDRYPHYAVYTEFPGDRSGEQDARVPPLIALYTLLSNAGLLSRDLALKASRRIRYLLDPLHPDARALLNRFPKVELDVDAAWTLYEFVAGQHQTFEQLVGLARKAAQQQELRQRSQRKVRRRLKPLPPPGEPLPPGIDVEPDPPDEEPAPPGTIDTPPNVLEIPKGSSLEPTMALRKWSAWTELQHQYLYWQWRTLNPQEIAVIRVELAQVLEAGDPLGLLLGLSLATARDAVDVLALRLRHPDSNTGDQADTDYWLELSAGVIEYPSVLPRLSYDPDARAREALLPVAQRIRIALPPTLVAACHMHLQSVAAGDLTLGEALGLDPDTVKKQVTDWCDAIRQADPRVRLSPARLREWPVYRALYLSRDIALVAHLYQLEIPGSTILYYAGFSGERLQAVHVAVMAEVFAGEAARNCDTPPIGSRLAVRPDALRAWILSWQQALSAHSTPFGHLFHQHPAGDSTGIRPPVPRPFGRGSRSEATQVGHCYSAGRLGVNVRAWRLRIDSPLRVIR